MRKNIFAVLTAAIIVMFAAVSFAAQAAKKMVPQVNCPVLGNKIDKQYYADYEGKRVYFCCPMCKPAFEKDPAKYMKVMLDKGEQAEAVVQAVETVPAANTSAAPSGK